MNKQSTHCSFSLSWLFILLSKKQEAGQESAEIWVIDMRHRHRYPLCFIKVVSFRSLLTKMKHSIGTVLVKSKQWHQKSGLNRTLYNNKRNCMFYTWINWFWFWVNTIRIPNKVNTFIGDKCHAACDESLNFSFIWLKCKPSTAQQLSWIYSHTVESKGSSMKY